MSVNTVSNEMKANKETINLSSIYQQITGASSYLCLSLDGHHGEALDSLLQEAGFIAESTSPNSKAASFQRYRVLADKRIEIIDSSFIGDFTQIRVYPNNTVYNVH